MLSRNAVLTPSEEPQGHRITCSPDALETDAVADSLRVVHRSGIFFKALANFE